MSTQHYDGKPLTPRARFFLWFHAPSSVAAGATVYMGGSNVNAEARASFTVPFACTARKITARSEAAAGAGESYVYTLRVNGAPTALTVTIGGAVETDDTFDADVAIAEDQYISVQLVVSAAAVSLRHTVTIEFD